MENTEIPTTGVISRTGVICINQSNENIFNYISNGDTLRSWLKKCGPINGAVKTVINGDNYNIVGASRTVYFDNGCTIKETLTWFDPYSYYSYRISDSTNFFKYLTAVEYGQWWFVDVNDQTSVKWTCTFVSKNLITKLVLIVFLYFFYARFMQQALQLAKKQIETGKA